MKITFILISCLFYNKVNASVLNFIINREEQSLYPYVNIDNIKFRAFTFSVNGKLFSKINGNFPDRDLALFLSNTKNEIQFTIDHHTIIPSKEFQSRLENILTHGLDSLSTNLYWLRISVLFFARKLTNIRLFYPTCHQLTLYLLKDHTSFFQEHLAKFRLLPFNYQTNLEMTGMMLLHDNKPVHSFIHIANGVCISKLGTNKVYISIQSLKYITCTKLCSINS